MRPYKSPGAWHRCKGLFARATSINNDGIPSTADNLNISVVDTDGNNHEAFVIFLPIDLARKYAEAINTITTSIKETE